MKRFIVNEQEKNSILNLYKIKNLILEEIKLGSYGLQYDTTKVDEYQKFEVVNFKQIFGIDVDRAEYSTKFVEAGIYSDNLTVLLDNFSKRVIIKTDEVGFNKAKENINKIKNNQINGNDFKDANPEFIEIFDLLSQNKLNLEPSKRKSFDFRIGGGGSNIEFGDVSFSPKSSSENKIAFCSIDSRDSSMRVFYKNGTYEDTRHYKIENDSVGNKNLIIKSNPNEIYGAYNINEEPIIQKGSRGPEVKKLQHNLLILGYDKFNMTKNQEGCKTNENNCDGIFGQKTRNAVIQYQRDNSLKDNGIVGFETLTSIEYNL